MIYVTGDIHGDYLRLHSICKNFTENDLIIVCGDFGIIYYNDRRDTKKIEYLSNLKCTIAFIDGNHENFDVLENYPEEQWHGGVIHRISSNIIHLERGYVFIIDGKKFFTFGGGYSQDRELRTEGIDLWAREMPSEAEYLRGIDNLKAYNFAVDFVLSHTAPLYAENAMGIAKSESRGLQLYLDLVFKITSFKKWYFGHYHIDRKISDIIYAVYDSIYEC